MQQLSDRLLEGSRDREAMSDLVDFQAKWRERIGRGSDFESALVRSSQVVASTCMGLAGFRGMDQTEFDLCIIDEASKATATETLLPLVRSRRWVLVGDDAQLPPFLDPAFTDRKLIEEFELEVDEMGRSLFSRLRAGLRPECKQTLTHQHRMVDGIGSLISECFYDGAIQNTAVPVPEWVEMTGLFQEQPVCWYSTELRPNRHESQQDRSYRNNCEVQQMKALLGNLDLVLSAQNCDEKIKVLLLAPYSAQVNAIRQSLQSIVLPSGNLSLEVNTVDAAQGREADVLLFSTTRSNSAGQIGFLKELSRANVALSRARYLLAIVGDASFLSLVESPFKRVLSHIRANPGSCSVSVVER
jgi:superfamily I DNA and/or RNA helicase